MVNISLYASGWLSFSPSKWTSQLGDECSNHCPSSPPHFYFNLYFQILVTGCMTFRSWYLMWLHLWRHSLQTSVHTKCAPSTQDLSQMALSSHFSVTFWNHMTLAAAMCMSIYRLALMRLLSYVKLRYMVQQVRSFKFMRLSIYSNVFWNAITFWIKKSPCTY